MAKHIKISDWFQPTNIMHVRGWHTFCTTGHWPEGLLPTNIELDAWWKAEIMQKMGRTWVAYMLSSEGPEA